MPKVTTILTSYNHENYIRESIESILNQTFKDFELIIIDDASTDNSWNIISSFSDSRIHSVRNKSNQKVGNIKKIIDEYDMGEYIAIHHSDDIWEADKLEKQVSFLDEHPNVGAVFSHATIIDESGQILTNDKHPYFEIFTQPNRSRHEWLRFFFFHGNALCNPSGLRRKSAYSQINSLKGLYQLPDFSLWIQLCLQSEIFILQEKLVRFRARGDNMNMSGFRPDTQTRMQFELLNILSHYKNIQNIDDFLLIFPEAQDYINEKNTDILYALGVIAVEKGTNIPTKLFGLNLLFDALNDTERADKLRRYQGFDIKRFINYTGITEIFSNDLIFMMTNTINQQNQQIHDLEQKVLFYSKSKSWRFTRPLRKLSSFLKKDDTA